MLRRQAPKPRLDWAGRAVPALAELAGSPVIELNHAVALAQVGDPAAALRAVDRLDLDGYLYFHSTRGELLRRLGRDAEARAPYRRALELATSNPRAGVPDPAARPALTRVVPRAAARSSPGYERQPFPTSPRQPYARSSPGIQSTLGPPPRVTAWHPSRTGGIHNARPRGEECTLSTCSGH